MRGFHEVPEGFVSYLEDWERVLLADLVGHVAAILDADVQGSLQRWDPRDTGVRQGESETESALLASLDFVPDEAKEAQDGAGHHGGRNGGAGSGDAGGASRPPVPGLAPLLEVLLPDASEDPETAVEVSRMTRSRLRLLKRERLDRVRAELIEPTGEDDGVLVRRAEAPQWLGAVNDLRLVLAEHLGLRQDQDVEALHALLQEDPPEGEEQWRAARRSLAQLYDVLTWWQESLVSVLLEGEAR